jgi:2-dehydropantoate 2-reductase
MKIGVMGAGGLGGFIGGRLALEGHRVSFITRGKHLKAICEFGLKVESPGGNFVIEPALATDDPGEVGPVDLVLLTVKSYDLTEAINAVKPMIETQTLIIPVLNGIEHIDKLCEGIGKKHVLGGLAMIVAHIAEPGLIHHSAANSLEFGEVGGGNSDRCKDLQDALSQDALEIKAVPNVIDRMWWKFAAICGAGVFTVMRGSKEDVWDFPETHALIRSTLSEVVAVANTKGIDLSSSVVDELLEMAGNFPPHYKPSMLVDLERGNRLEIEALNGSLCRIGKQVGISTPVNDFIYACLQPFADGYVGQ